MTSDAWVIAQSVATIAATAFAVPMIYLATRQLRVAAEAYKAAAHATAGSALGAVAATSRELQWKVLENKSLHPIVVPDSGPEGLADPQKQNLVRGMLISNYAFIYELWRLGQIPEAVWPAMKVDMVEFFRAEPNIASLESIEGTLRLRLPRFCGKRDQTKAVTLSRSTYVVFQHRPHRDRTTTGNSKGQRSIFRGQLAHVRILRLPGEE